MQQKAAIFGRTRFGTPPAALKKMHRPQVAGTLHENDWNDHYIVWPRYGVRAPP